MCVERYLDRSHCSVAPNGAREVHDLREERVRKRREVGERKEVLFAAGRGESWELTGRFWRFFTTMRSLPVRGKENRIPAGKCYREIEDKNMRSTGQN